MKYAVILALMCWQIADAQTDSKTKVVFKSMADAEQHFTNRAKYPFAAIDSGQSGFVLTKFTVNKLGKVGNLQIIFSETDILADEVVRLIATTNNKWSFNEQGAHETDIVLPVYFTIFSPQPKKSLSVRPSGGRPTAGGLNLLTATTQEITNRVILLNTIIVSAEVFIGKARQKRGVGLDQD